MKTEIVKILDKNLAEYDKELRFAAKIIQNGGLVVFPTETVYGIGGDATNPVSAEKIYTAKGRPSDNPLIIHVSKPEEAENYAFTGELYYALAERFMPGPLTVILNSRDTVPKKTRGGLSTVAVRCPENPIANRLIELSGVPIAAPSANLSGSPSPTSAGHVIEDMDGRVDMIIDGGECDFGLESTIVKIEDDATLTLLRPGKITLDELRTVADVRIADAVTDKLRDGERALSPGMKYRHYAPKSPVVLLDGECAEAVDYVMREGDARIAVLCYTEDGQKWLERIPGADIYELGAREDEQLHAHRLFKLLRDTDKKNYEKIYAPLPRKEGIGLALYNRLIRAAGHTIINLKRCDK